MKDLYEELNRAHELDEGSVNPSEQHLQESGSTEELSPFDFDGKVYVYDGAGWTDDTSFEVVGKRDKIIIKSYNSSSGDTDERIVSTYDEAAEFVNDVLTGYGEAAETWQELGWYLDEAVNKYHSTESPSRLNENIKPDSVVNQIVNAIEKSQFTNRSISSAGSTITMEDSDGNKTTYAVRIKYIPEFTLEEELAGTIVQTVDRSKFVEEAAIRIIKK